MPISQGPESFSNLLMQVQCKCQNKLPTCFARDLLGVVLSVICGEYGCTGTA